jgi:hypothetical protein
MLAARVFGGSKIPKKKIIQIIQKTLVHLCMVSRFPPSVITRLRSNMVYQKISPDRKQQALYLFLEKGWKLDRIAIALGVSEKSMERWHENYYNIHDVSILVHLCEVVHAC